MSGPAARQRSGPGNEGIIFDAERAYLMPYRDREAQRAYQREWMAQRRADYLAGQSCVDCGATESLEIDHRDPALKVDHRIWSWTRERLEDELAKCEPRCAPCHRARHGEQRKRHGIRRYEAGCRCDTCRSAKSRKNLTNRRNRAQRERAFEEGRLF